MKMDFFTNHENWIFYFSMAIAGCCFLMLILLVFIAVVVARMRRRLERILHHSEFQLKLIPPSESENPAGETGANTELLGEVIAVRTQNGAKSRLETAETAKLSTFKVSPKSGQKKSPRLRPAPSPKAAHAPVPPVPPKPESRTDATQATPEDDYVVVIQGDQDEECEYIDCSESVPPHKAEKVQNDDDHMYDECKMEKGGEEGTYLDSSDSAPPQKAGKGQEDEYHMYDECNLANEAKEMVYDEAVNPEPLPQPVSATRNPKAAVKEDQYVVMIDGVGGVGGAASGETGNTEEYVEFVRHDVTTDAYETPTQTSCQSNYQRKPETSQPKQKVSPGPTPALPVRPGKKPNERENVTKAPDRSPSPNPNPKALVFENKSAFHKPQASPPTSNDRERNKATGSHVTGLHVSGSHVTGSHMTGSHVIYANEANAVCSLEIYQNQSAIDAGEGSASFYENVAEGTGNSKAQPVEDVYENLIE